MKRLIILFLLFITAIAISPILIGEKGYILISMGNMTFESTVVTASIFLFILFITLTLLLRLFLGGINLGRGTWRKVSSSNKRKAERNFKQGVSTYLLADYEQAEKQLIKSTDHLSSPSVAYLLAASAAQQQLPITKSSANLEYYLKCLANLNHDKTSIEHVLVTIKLYMQCKNYSDAATLMNQYHKHIGHDERLLKLAMDLALAQQHYQQVIDYLSQAYKAKNISEMYIADVEYSAYLGRFSELLDSQSSHDLFNYWKELSRKQKHKNAIVFAYCKVLAQHQLTDSLEALLLPQLKFNANETFIKKLRELPVFSSLTLIKAVQKHLQKDPENTKWLSLLAFLTFANKQLDLSIKAYTHLFSNASYQDKQDAELYVKALILKDEHQLASKVMSDYLLS